jgi:hypothetical protein
MVELQTQYAEQVISALTLKSDPVLAMVEINKETSLSHAWQSELMDRVVTGEYRQRVQPDLPEQSRQRDRRDAGGRWAPSRTGTA